MTFTYTSDDLSKIAASIPSYASEAGLVDVPGVEIEKEVDVRIDSEDVDIVAALQVAVLVKTPFICVDASPFSVGMLRAAQEYSDLPTAAERLLKSAEMRDGSLMSVTVSWVSDGLCYQWRAQSEWIGPLLIEIDAAIENAEAEAEAEHENFMDEYRTAFQAAVSALVESPKFRGEQLGKRRLVAPSILAEAGVEEPPTVFMSHRVMPEANKIVRAKAYEYEQDFSTRVSQLADELREYPDWKRVYTKGKRTAAAVKFLIEKADGYRLPTPLAEEISEAAAIPFNSARTLYRPDL
jgi:hypothetical protein